MKVTYGWYADGNGTNSSGFSGLPGGFCDGSGNFDNAGAAGYWWSSSPPTKADVDSVWDRWLYREFESIQRSGSYVRAGLSVRCFRDAE